MLGPPKPAHNPLLRQLPNAFTVSRIILSALIMFHAASQAWNLCLWLLIAAILSDFLDGLAAKKLHAGTSLGAILDPVADCLLAAVCILSLAINGHIPVWTVIAMAASAAIIGAIKFFPGLPHNSPSLQAKTQAFSVAYLFTVWVGGAWALASLAHGWSWLYPVITVLLLSLAALFKRHRIAAWYGK